VYCHISFCCVELYFLLSLSLTFVLVSRALELVIFTLISPAFAHALSPSIANSNSPSGRSRAFQIGFARTRSDTDAAHMRKAPVVMQMRQTGQMQIDEDACIRN